MTRLHATCIARDGYGVLITGGSGTGKSDLALRLIDRGAQLVSDDYTEVEEIDGRLIARPPRRIAGLMEVRGIGIITMPYLAEAIIALHITLDDSVPRLPDDGALTTIAGVAVPRFALAGLEPSAPIKLEVMLARVLKDNA